MNQIVYPQALNPAHVKVRCYYAGITPQLDALAARGIILNTWQAAELFNEGNRGIGKTFLSFVKLAEQDYINISLDNFNVPDPDYNNDTPQCMKIEYIRSLELFLQEFYLDKFKVVANRYSLVATKCKTNVHWWDNHD